MTEGGPASDRLFDPVPPEELRQRSAQSGLARMAGQAIQLVLAVGSGMVLARLLTPEDFGILAMVTVVTGLADSVRHFGLPQAAVQSDALTHELATAVFWRGLQLSGRVVLAMILSAPVIAAAYREPRVTAVLVALSLGFAARSLTAVHEALLMRRIRFGVLSAIEAGAMAIALTVGIVLALLGAGYLALVVQALVLDILRAVATGLSIPWRPGPRRSVAGADPAALFTFGRDVTRFRLLSHCARNVDRLIVGLAQGATTIGFYDAAYRWSRYPLDQVAGPLANVALASLARVRHDPSAYRRACTIGLLPMASVIIGALAFFALEAERTILVLLGDQWGPAVPIFTVLCVCGAAAVIIRIAKWLFLVEGNTAAQVRWGLVYFVVMTACSIVGLKWGVFGVAVGYTVGTWLMVPSAVSTSLRGSTLRPRDLYGIFVRPGIAAALATAATAGMGLWFPGGERGIAGAVTLLRQAAVFGVVFAGVWLVLPGGTQRWHDVVQILRAARPDRTGRPPLSPSGGQDARLP